MKNLLRTAHLHKTLFTIVALTGAFLLALTGCRSASVEAIGSATPQFDMASAAVYQFSGNGLQPTILHVDSSAVSAPFMAEVRDNHNTLVATLNSGTLRRATFTIPQGDVQYTVHIASVDAISAEHISVTLSYPESQTATNAGTATRAANFYEPAICAASTPHEGGVNVRVSPDETANVIAVLPPNIPAQVDLQTITGWYRVEVQGVFGWLNGQAVTLNGVCNSLPVDYRFGAGGGQTMLARAIGGAAIPGVTASFDVDTHYFRVDRNTGGSFQDDISYPHGDSVDRILLDASAVSGYAATYALMLACSGSGTEDLRWGLEDDPGLMCGQSMPLPVGTGTGQSMLMVMFPGSAGQRYIEYTLYAIPFAPADADQHAFGIHRDAGGLFTEVVSYPNGDSFDMVQVVVSGLEALPPHSYRDVQLTLRCEGSNTSTLRWGTPENPSLPCDSTIVLPFSFEAFIQPIVVNIAPDSPQSYVRYTLQAAPVAPEDAPEYVFGIDRSGGGQFNEMLSYPAGDGSDSIILTVANLGPHAPNDRRTIDLTLVCNGQGAEFVRWGSPDNPGLLCGMTVTASFNYANNRIPLIVTVPEGLQAYVSYTLVAAISAIQ